jgi:hypothetical protein
MDPELEFDLLLTLACADGEPVRVRLTRVRGTTWGECVAVVQTDATSAARGCFHDTPENRLEELEGGFNAAMPVWIELAPRPELVAALPDLSRASAERLVSEGQLAREDAWNALQVWQEHPLAGTVIKAGYRTVFSAPANDIDALRRRGRVTRTVVDALIENGLAVHFDQRAQAFQIGFAVGESTYTCHLGADDEATALSLTVDGPPVDAAVAAINRELRSGTVEVVDGHLRYTLNVRADPSLVTESWVIETLRAGVSVAHHATRA